MTQIEHLNITVPDIDETLMFLSIVAPDFKIRKDVDLPGRHRWVHVGNEQSYFALQEPHLDSLAPRAMQETYKNHGVNHIGLVVQNLQTIETKLVEQGYRRGIYAPRETHRKRAYFYDKAGFEWELTEFLSDIHDEMYLYE
ncbi:VOC family protein [Vibrio alginolyticus]|uniref:VOC family protein n=1 Tax=Vibrio chagasii TaxID=170679 RepID=A0A7V7NRL4_9VIBR|nr:MULTISPECIES: VOC family protein [Vibrio]MDE9380338.1 VOC family protein [Vibrio alginolyticus]KAB0476707.1 VOC family protein [Vibrio chagasii]MCG9563157.1 VOC family protein [Vibrio chagasii]MCG9566813.1 VOC family protein [Vibrio chagasii]MCG9604377.1 VOC family protein [Vibrio chagasii]|tara:strand:+ start:1160 stop:1582 length:423 start_codon:yes stop_codon:yes gene_type:complete